MALHGSGGYTEVIRNLLDAEVPGDVESSHCRNLQTRPDELQIEVQKVEHASRVHIDIETNNIEAEVKRLEALGAKRVSDIRGWVVMEAPTGQRFCVIQPQRANFEAMANHWD